MTDAFRSAVAAHRAGQLETAENGYRTVLAENSAHADALHLMGLIALHRGDLATAERYIDGALRQRTDVNFLNNLGIVLQRAERFDEAESAFRRGIDHAPSQIDIRLNLANLLRRTAQPAPLVEAECLQALDLKPDHVDALNLLGLLRLEAGRLDEAAATFARVMQLRPTHVDARVNTGVVLDRKGEVDDAIAALELALEIDANHVAGLVNLGILLRKVARLEEAEHLLGRALAIDPAHTAATVSLSYVLLGLGRYTEAWPLYEARYAAGQGTAFAALPTLACPPWRGEDLAGRSLVLWPEQGYGDVIQFARFVPALKAGGLRRLTLVCPPALAPLLAGLDGVDAVVADADAVPPHDYWCLVASLPRWLGTTLDTIPPPPRLRVAPGLLDRWRERLPAASLRVGLVWRGSATHGNDAARSLPGLATLEPLWAVPGVVFVSLQKGLGEPDAERWAAQGRLMHFSAEIQDFADLAAIVSGLDLVICVDTALAHLAGTLGKPCWVLLPAFGLDWRWLQGRSDSPWYPGTMRLFRQSERGDWSTAVAEVTAALRAWRTQP